MQIPNRLDNIIPKKLKQEEEVDYMYLYTDLYWMTVGMFCSLLSAAVVEAEKKRPLSSKVNSNQHLFYLLVK